MPIPVPMPMPMRCGIFWIAVFVAVFAGGVRTEEGFWPFDMVPKGILAQRYGFDVSDEWLDKARRSAVSVDGNGSGAFVSPHGLVMTNRHVASSMLQKLSVIGKTDRIRDGFLARTQAEELKIPDAHVDQVIEIVNVNERVAATAARMKSSDDAAMRVVFQEEQAKESRKGLVVRPMRLYPDGEFRLHIIKVYDDVRMVFGADYDSGYFGGDEDNFNYPRFNFDVAFLRAYENGKPAETPDHFTWSPCGAKENELVFFAGGPDRTQRLLTLAHLQLTRDVLLPSEIAQCGRWAEALHRFAALGPNQAQRIRDKEQSIENGLKRMRGQTDALRDPNVFVLKKSDDEALMKSIADPAKARQYADAVEELRLATEKYGKDEATFGMINGVWGSYSAQLVAAVRIVGMEEVGTYDFADAKSLRDSWEERFYYDPAHRPESERRFLTESLALLLKRLGPENAIVKLMLDGKTPEARADELLKGSKLGEPEFYTQAPDKFPGIDSSGDAMLILAKSFVRYGRELNARHQAFAAIEKRSYAAMGQALAGAGGQRRSPDGNLSLRLSFGTVRGYEDQGQCYGPFTCFGCMYQKCDRAGNNEPYHLNSTWLQGREKLNPCTPINFVTDADGYSGNSGSPVFNRNREIVGMLFDTNYPGLLGKFMYDGRTKRAICVDSRAITEVMARLYNATELVKEFGW